MKVLVCGGRRFGDYQRLFDTLDFLRPKDGNGITHVIHGGAEGADQLAGEWAIMRGVPLTVYSAKWSKHGRAAGPIRNQQMLDEGKPDVVVACPGGRGTEDMVTRARRAGVRVIEIEPRQASQRQSTGEGK